MLLLVFVKVLILKTINFRGVKWHFCSTKVPLYDPKSTALHSQKCHFTQAKTMSITDKTNKVTQNSTIFTIVIPQFCPIAISAISISSF